MREPKKLFGESSFPRFRRLPPLKVFEVLTLELDHVREEVAFDFNEVLPSLNILTLYKDTADTIKPRRSHVCHGFSPVDTAVVFCHQNKRWNGGILLYSLDDLVNRALVNLGNS